MPLAVPGVVLGALGFALSVLMTDWWGAFFLVAVSMVIIFFWTGETGWGLFSVCLVAGAVLGAVRQWRRS